MDMLRRQTMISDAAECVQAGSDRPATGDTPVQARVAHSSDPLPATAGIGGVPLYDPISLHCAAAQPVKLLNSSAGMGWNALLLDHIEAKGRSEAFETHATTDLTLVAAVAGRHRVEAYGRGVWRSAIYQPGASGMTPPHEIAKLRWEALGASRRFEMVHLYLPYSTIVETCDAYRRSGQAVPERPLDALVFNDPTVSQLCRTLLMAMRAGAPDLYADQVSRTLALHLLSRLSSWSDIVRDERDPGIISDRRMSRVIEYMSANLSLPLTASELAREAGMSVHHFSRCFRSQTGRTPSAFLTDLRFDLARRLLRTTDLPIGEIALGCGYGQAAAFSAAFLRRFGRTPREDRAAAPVGTRQRGWRARGRSQALG